jgi:nitrite reductase/ring-hydroxylating ferredoxin subunit
VDRQPLFQLEEIPDGGSRGFEVSEPGLPAQRLLAVRLGSSVHVYLNICPHRGTPLDWRPDDFLDADGEHIVCASHGALFRIEDGVCLAGPCIGDQLEPFPVEVKGGAVYGPEGVARCR